METPLTLPQLSAEEQRVLGALMEKASTTPEYYPLTLNSLVTACNQKTSRNPVVNYDDDTVMATLDSLKKKGLVATVTGGSSRAVKYRHNFAVVYPVLPAEVAVICLLLLRGPQTSGELNAHIGRMHAFETLDELQSLLQQLANASPAYIKQLTKRPGQKEGRYAHLLGDIKIPETDTEPGSVPNGVEMRLATVEAELAALREEFDQLMRQLS
ncbi:YceH family protein [Parapedobacter lycopersici]|uniref:YceH family protein n=1 Tax=Parapedobacter lycopersici TaxID=1864939 RepID=UPI0033423D23